MLHPCRVGLWSCAAPSMMGLDGGVRVLHSCRAGWGHGDGVMAMGSWCSIHGEVGRWGHGVVSVVEVGDG